jgi:hypothetical protein
MISALRLVIDHEQATVLDGGSADLGKLNVAVASLIALLPNRELPQPAVEHARDDPRQLLLDQYMAMRERGGISDEGKWVDEIEALKAEVAELKARLAGKTEHSDVPTMVKRVPAPAAAGNVVPLSRPNPPAAPAYDYDQQRGWRDYVLPDGNITPAPISSGGKWWGPV